MMRRAFSLIELLVAVAIISLLVTVLMPSLQQARELAYTTVCQSTMRSAGASLTLYCEENVPGKWVATCTWLDVTNKNFVYTRVLLNKGYASSIGALRCTKHHRYPAGITSEEQYNSTVTIAYGLRCSPGWGVGVPAMYKPYAADPIAAGFPLLTDSADIWDATTNHAQTCDIESYARLVHTRHQNRASIFFGDGHTDLMAYEDLLPLKHSQHFMFRRLVLFEDETLSPVSNSN